MDPEQKHAAQPQTSKFDNLRKVTPFSKYLAMAIFIILPFIGGYVGYTFAPEKVAEVEKQPTESVEDPVNKNSTPSRDSQGFSRTHTVSDNYQINEYYCGDNYFISKTCFSFLLRDQNGEYTVLEENLSNAMNEQGVYGGVLDKWIATSKDEQKLYFTVYTSETDGGAQIVELEVPQLRFTLINFGNLFLGDKILVPSTKDHGGLKIVRATSSGNAFEIYDAESKDIVFTKRLEENETLFGNCFVLGGGRSRDFTFTDRSDLVYAVYDKTNTKSSQFCGDLPTFLRYDFIEDVSSMNKL